MFNNGATVYYVASMMTQTTCHAETQRFFTDTLSESQNPTQFKTLEGQYVEDFKPGSIKESREFLEEYKEVENFKVYADTVSISVDIRQLLSTRRNTFRY